MLPSLPSLLLVVLLLSPPQRFDNTFKISTVFDADSFLFLIIVCLGLLPFLTDPGQTRFMSPT
jgi:hypothetical protein